MPWAKSAASSEGVIEALGGIPGRVEGFDQEGQMTGARGSDAVIRLIDGKDDTGVDVLPDHLDRIGLAMPGTNC